jgi:hypothetical protein
MKHQMVRSWLRSGAITEKRIIPPVRYLLLGSSQKQISLTQLASLLPGALVAPARPDILAAK